MTPSRAAPARRTAAVALALMALAAADARADAVAGERKAQLCLLCHKPDNPHAYVPTLEGQTREYLVRQIRAYKARKRPDTVMQTNVMTLTERDMRDIADYFASRKPLRVPFAVDADKVARGREEATSRGCASCHGHGFAGARETPRLAGMEPRYAASQMLAFSAGRRAHPRIGPGDALTAESAAAIAQFLAQLH